jgi:putative membrane protein
MCITGIAWGQNPPPTNAQPRPQPFAPGQQLQPGQLQPGQLQPGQLQPGQQRQQLPGQQGQQAANTQRAGSSDQQIAALVCGCAQNEIEIAKLAQDKARAAEVKQFAEQMVRDHTPGYEAMRQLAGPLATGGETSSRGHEAGELDWVRIHQEVGRQCLASTKQELGKKEGAEFDHCFMGQQIGAHMKVVDELKVLRNHASPELRQKLDQELQMATAHLQKAKQIEEQVTERAPDRISRKPE